MKYCCLNYQRTGSCYFEFQIGKFAEKYWLDNSIYLSADSFDSLNLFQVFVKAVPKFEYYGITEIDSVKWNQIKLTADSFSDDTKCAINEINSWIKPFLCDWNKITILGL